MSHAAVRHDSCLTTIHVRWFHSRILSDARGVTDGGVGSGDLFGGTQRWKTGVRKSVVMTVNLKASETALGKRGFMSISSVRDDAGHIAD